MAICMRNVSNILKNEHVLSTNSAPFYLHFKACSASAHPRETSHTKCLACHDQ